MSGDATENQQTVTSAAALAALAAFGALDAREAAAIFERLHERVALHRGRVEITRHDSDDRCVLISKAELDSLERAIEILSNTDSGQAMRNDLSSLAADLSESPEPAAS